MRQMKPSPLKKVRNTLGCTSLALFAFSCAAFWFFFMTLKEEPPPTVQTSAHDISGWLMVIIPAITILVLVATVITAVLAIIKERLASRR